MGFKIPEYVHIIPDGFGGFIVANDAVGGPLASSQLPERDTAVSLYKPISFIVISL